MASSKEEFVGIVKQLRKFVQSNECAECSCPNIRCELHGDCYNCIRVYRHFGHHVPRCLQFVFDAKIASITKAVNEEMGAKPLTPNEYYDYLNSVAPKKDTSPDP